MASAAFDQFFLKVYGTRWPGLRDALLLPDYKVQVTLFDGFSKYRLDPASVVVANQVPVQEGFQVLDGCAAPGGKTLMLLDRIFQQKLDAQLVSNEVSFSRRKRLEKVIEEHVPETIRSKLQIKGQDMAQVGLKVPGRFDSILLDAPCSSERHLMHQDPELTDWREARSKQLAKRQYSLLCSALLAAKPGGTVVYSTCSISPLENDEVIRRVIGRNKGVLVPIQLLADESSGSVVFETTEFGAIALPDRSQGAGPMYFAVMEKIE